MALFLARKWMLFLPGFAPAKLPTAVMLKVDVLVSVKHRCQPAEWPSLGRGEFYIVRAEQIRGCPDRQLLFVGGALRLTSPDSHVIR